MTTSRWIFLIFLALFTGCRHENGAWLSRTAPIVDARRNIQGRERLASLPVPEKISVAVFSDSHEDYGDLKSIIREINAMTDLDFVVNTGDFTNQGKPEQYQAFLEIAAALKAPVFTVPGNHDVENDGDRLFAPLFGPAEFSFERGGFRFLFLRSTGVESPKVEGGPRPVVAFLHVPKAPGPAAKGASWRLLVNGHRHRSGQGTADGAMTLQVARVRGRQWVRLDLHPSGVRVTRYPEKETFELRP